MLSCWHLGYHDTLIPRAQCFCLFGRHHNIPIHAERQKHKGQIINNIQKNCVLKFWPKKNRWKRYLCHLYLMPCQLPNQRGSHVPDNNSRICGRPASYDDLWVVSGKTCLFSCFKVDGIFQFPSISSQLTKHRKKFHFQLAKNKFLGRS